VYSYETVPDAVAQVDELPVPALSAYAELIAFLELTPWEGAPYRADKPDGNMRAMPFGKRAEGMAIYVILEEQRRVVVVSVTWLELELAEETAYPCDACGLKVQTSRFIRSWARGICFGKPGVVGRVYRAGWKIAGGRRDYWRHPILGEFHAKAHNVVP
jgi:hypothetical protein